MYTLEFIKSLPEYMQASVANLNSQIASLEEKRAKLQLPVDVSISLETLAKNKEDAEEILIEAEAHASAILAKADATAKEIIEKAEIDADDARARAVELVDAALIKEDKLKVKEDDLSVWAAVLEAKEKAVADAKAAHDTKVEAHKAKAKNAIKALAEL
jgi:hypothetical protein